MPKCPCCHSEIQNFRGILFHDLDRAVYVDDMRYGMEKRAYRALKAIYDHGPLSPARLSLILFGHPDGTKRVKEDVSVARATLGNARLQISYPSNGGGDEYRILEFKA